MFQKLEDKSNFAKGERLKRKWQGLNRQFFCLEFSANAIFAEKSKK